jgi:20S proteasome alpha/beta subunit
MTVCIAAVCNYGLNSQPVIVAASDRMITIGELEYEPEQTKTVNLANQTVALVAGDMQLHAAIIPKVCERIRLSLADDPRNINVANIAEFYAEEFAFYRRKLAEREILFPIGLDFDRFLTRQSTMAHYQVTRLHDLLTSYYADSTAIIAGLDPTGGHVYKISNPGVAMCHDTPYFACAGSGEFLASTQFMVAGFEKNWPLAKALWLTFTAKAKAESAGGVGTHTDLLIVQSGGRITSASSEAKNHLYKLFKQVTEKEAEAAQEAVKEIEEQIKSLNPPQTPTNSDTQQSKTEADNST